MADLRTRLSFIVEAIDNGRYRTPEEAADAIIDVVLSVHRPHQAELVDLMNKRWGAPYEG